MSDFEERLSQVLVAKAVEAPRAEGLVRAARARHVRRRRTRLGAVAVGTVAVLVPLGLLGIGTGGDRPVQPEPLGPYTYGQHQHTSDAVPADRAPGFETLDYGVASHSPELPLADGSTLAPVLEYLDVDQRGRLTALHLHGPAPTATYRLVPGPGRPAQEIPDPLDGSAQRGIWEPTFLPDGRLLWSNGAARGLHDPLWTSDADGGDLQPLDPPRTDVPADAVDAAYRGQVWVDGGRVWFSAVTKVDGPRQDQTQWVSLYSYDPRQPQRVRRQIPVDASAIDVAGGRAVWVDEQDTRVYAEDLASHDVHEVPVPLDDGCRIMSTVDVSAPSSEAVVTNGSLVAVTEYCPDRRTTRLVVTDLSGRLVTDVDAGQDNGIYYVALGDGTVAFVVQQGEGGGGSHGDGHTTYLDDLDSGELVDLGEQVPDYDSGVRAAGRYVLWYAGTEGHVGRLAPQ